MKLGMVMMLAGLVGAMVIGPMFIQGPTGQPIMTVDDWVPEALERPVDLTGAVPAGVYTWTDKQGVVHYSDVRPSHLSRSEVETLDVGHTMTLPKEAFTGPGGDAQEDPVLSGPMRVLLRRNGQSVVEGDEQGSPLPGTEGQAAMQGALDEIAERFPQFKTMSDEMAHRLSTPTQSRR